MIIREHEKLPLKSDSFDKEWKEWREGMPLPSQGPGLDRWFFQWQWGTGQTHDSNADVATNDGSGYYATYVIGAQWLDKERTKPLVITTKRGCDKIDFLEMFSVCFHSGNASSDFSKIYDVDMNLPRIKAPELKSVLSPLIVVHFLSVVQSLVKRGLKKGYLQCEENLNKVRGHVSIMGNERTNVMIRRFNKVVCNYQKYTTDIPENRLIKKALLFAQAILDNTASSKGMTSLKQVANLCLSAFCEVNEQIEVWEVKNIKRHKMFKEYDDAIRLAQMILRRYDYSITNIDSAESDYCPVFWLDMSLLYEHYVFGLLREAYGEKIHYQERGYTGYPDFVCYNPNIVMDTKYIPGFGQNHIDAYIIRQLSGYARDSRLFKEQPAEVIPCVVIYPKEGVAANPFKSKSLDDLFTEKETYATDFYKIAVPLPTIG